MTPGLQEALRFTVSLHVVSLTFDRTLQDHLDWFFQTRPDFDEPLFTIATNVDIVASKPIAAEQLPDHRGDYLDFAGPVSSDRGKVFPLLIGTFQWGRRAPDSIEVCLRSVEVQPVSDQNLTTGLRTTIESVVQEGHAWTQQIERGRTPWIKFNMDSLKTRD